MRGFEHLRIGRRGSELGIAFAIGRLLEMPELHFNHSAEAIAEKFDRAVKTVHTHKSYNPSLQVLPAISAPSAPALRADSSAALKATVKCFIAVAFISGFVPF
jgi:hypothetical protein